MAIPSLLAVSGVQQHLVRTKKRTAVGIIIETGEPKAVHEFSDPSLVTEPGPVNPYLAYASIHQLIEDEYTLQKDYLCGRSKHTVTVY